MLQVYCGHQLEKDFPTCNISRNFDSNYLYRDWWLPSHYHSELHVREFFVIITPKSLTYQALRYKETVRPSHGVLSGYSGPFTKMTFLNLPSKQLTFLSLIIHHSKHKKDTYIFSALDMKDVIPSRHANLNSCKRIPNMPDNLVLLL